MPGTIGSGGNILYSWLVGPILTPTSVPANTTVEQSFLIPGLQLVDNVSVNCQLAQNPGIGIANCRVSSAGVLQIGFSNSTAAAITPAAGQYQLCICRPEANPLPINAI